jgi:hypothetical protein
MQPMKKRSLFTLLLTASFTLAQAQISDVDAKLQFKQAQDAYEQGDYFKAWQTASSLEHAMNRPTTTVSYLVLISTYKGLLKGDLHPSNTSAKYKYYSYYLDKCDWLLNNINKASYPPDKYKEVTLMQQYFGQMQQKYAYQTTRTPEKAVSFLNECATKFRKDKYSAPFKFQLINNQLKISSHVTKHVREAYHRLVGKMYRGELRGECVFFDFSKMTAIDDNGVLSGYTVYIDNKKVEDYVFIHSANSGNTYGGDRNKLDKEWSQEQLKQQALIDSVTAPDRSFGRTLCSAFDFFDTTSQEFTDGSYKSRLVEAYQYLIDYFPKTAPQEESLSSQDRSNGF